MNSLQGAIHDHGQDDPLQFDLGSWAPVAVKVRESIEEQTGRELTDIELAVGES